jgi:uncharacterized protein YecE (DUF72 family)
MMRLAVGTSGYAYREWKGPGRFYPRGMKAAAMLPFYASRFGTVEINSSFYKMPEPDVVAAWAAVVPPEFMFAFKAPGAITHQKRLAGVRKPVAQLWRAVEVLGAQLGPVLFGLPPNMKKDVARLEELLALCPAGRRVAVEFRHESWFAHDVYDVLAAHGAALCVADTPDLATPLVVTADWGYVRLRRERYGPIAMARWLAQLGTTGWSDAVVYFKHEDTARAPRLAERLIRLAAAGEPAAPAT